MRVLHHLISASQVLNTLGPTGTPILTQTGLTNIQQNSGIEVNPVSSVQSEVVPSYAPTIARKKNFTATLYEKEDTGASSDIIQTVQNSVSEIILPVALQNTPGLKKHTKKVIMGFLGPIIALVMTLMGVMGASVIPTVVKSYTGQKIVDKPQ